MSFAEDVKNELCQYEASSDADVAMKIEASCLLRMSGSIILGMKGAVGIRLATANNAVARRLLGILKKQYELPTNVLVRQGLNLRKKNMYTLSVEPSNLEFMTGNETFAREIIHVLRLFHIHAGLTERKDEYVVYLKEGDAVTNCLQIMGAQSALMEFENVRIMKTVRNQINRQVNCETANLQKVVDAAVRQVKAIRIIDREIGIEELPEKLRVVARLRWENPEASLKELEELMEGELSKSG
ncbi:MAG: DNA-binding protein WhiA, partial [Veillonella sp.]|nr:DNA-binding protein WhiA [Veillonella sp.]